MATDSRTSGYLQPSVDISPQNVNPDVENVLHDAIAGITGLANNMVRPTRQANPPQEPADLTTDWAAFTVLAITPFGPPAFLHKGSGGVTTEPGTEKLTGGWDKMDGHEKINVLFTFYGNNAWTNAEMLKDGLYLAQNREILTAQGIGMVEVSNLVSIPELVNNNFRRRIDIHAVFNRQVNRSYGIRNIQESQGTVTPDSGSVENWDTANVTQ